MMEKSRFHGLVLAVALGSVALGGSLHAQQGSTPPAAPAAAPAPTTQKTPAETKPRSTAEDNPFPEDVSKQAATAAAADERADRKAAASGSAAATGDEDSSSSRDKFQDLDLLGDHDSRISNGAGGVVVNTKLSDDDVRIGTFYLQTGDYQGAYDRFKEAVEVNPDNPEAVFRLAEAARKLNRKDEALTNYEIYMAALPDGPHAKAIRKAMNELAKK